MNGFPLTSFELALNDAEANERNATNAEIAAARGAIKECIRLVSIQAKGSAADFSAVLYELDAALSELPEARS